MRIIGCLELTLYSLAKLNSANEKKPMCYKKELVVGFSHCLMDSYDNSKTPLMKGNFFITQAIKRYSLFT